MISVRVTRTEDDGRETELGELRLTEVGAVYSYRETAEGAGVMRDVRAKLEAKREPALAAKPTVKLSPRTWRKNARGWWVWQ